MSDPLIIQGGMGVAISNWRLARAVSQLGQLGVVSGTGLTRVVASRLMDGDPGAHMRRALESFPFPESVHTIVRRYYLPGGKSPAIPYKIPPAHTVLPSRFADAFTVIANYAEVFLAKHGHTGPVGVNLLEKVQLPNLASIYGAMLAGVDYLLMGAGIPVQVAAVIDRLSRHEPVSYRLDVQGARPDDDFVIHFDPERLFPGIAQRLGQLKRPRFIPIISSTVLASALMRRSDGVVDGFVVEGPSAGGHNAPPRGPLHLNAGGEPVYGDKDIVASEKMRAFGVPFWLAGGYGHPGRLRDALADGAAGVQVGTPFSLCDESGMEPGLKRRVLDTVRRHGTSILTAATVSPTGFPFKVVRLEGTLSDEHVYAARGRICDLRFLRTLFKKADGSIGYRCPAEPWKTTCVMAETRRIRKVVSVCATPSMQPPATRNSGTTTSNHPW
ncbi:MAG TPA: nitronate monooxygenase [Candidatus Krumholzibacteria bacterium]|nr:nitronate monooxygenase [Candidatus Krumholzibacteria bacterium]